MKSLIIIFGKAASYVCEMLTWNEISSESRIYVESPFIIVIVILIII